MKIKAIVFTAILSLILNSGFAQGNQQRGQQGPPPIPNDKQVEEMVDRMATELSLTKDQKAKVLELHKAHFKEMKEKMESGKRPERKEMDKLRQDFETELKAVLTKEQIKKLEKLMKNQRRPDQRPGSKSE